MPEQRIQGRLEAFFQTAGNGAGGQRLYLHHLPHAEPARAAVVYVHPFAEEMNKSRRMAALGARALAAEGMAVLQVDLHGCGDSSGDFGDATWEAWVADVCEAMAWMKRRHPGVPLWLWGLRAGALLCSAAAAAAPAGPVNFLFWQPVTRGALVLTPFLRLLVAAGLADGAGKAALAAARADLAAGRHVEVAGYSLNPALARGLEGAELVPPAMGAAQPADPAAVERPRVVWVELAEAEGAAISPAGATAAARWASAGFEVECITVPGPKFWQTVEIEDAPALVEATAKSNAQRAAAKPDGRQAIPVAQAA